MYICMYVICNGYIISATASIRVTSERREGEGEVEEGGSGGRGKWKKRKDRKEIEGKEEEDREVDKCERTRDR